MAVATPTMANLQVLITTLQAQVSALMAAAPAPAATAAVIFANTPQLLKSSNLIDYLTKRGASIYEQGCKALNNKALIDKFGMTPDQTVVFVEAHLVAQPGWDGTKAPSRSPHTATAMELTLMSSSAIAESAKLL